MRKLLLVSALTFTAAFGITSSALADYNAIAASDK